MITNQSVFQSMQTCIPGGVNSPVRSAKQVGGCPLIIERGEGEFIFDVENKRYIDYVMSWGALIHGHAHPVITEAIKKRVEKGSSFGYPTAIEGELAKKVCEIVPSIEQVRFVNSGTEATMSAVRLARGFTGRSMIVKFDGNYHGHADHFLIKAGSGLSMMRNSSSCGIPHGFVQETLSLPYNDCESLLNLVHDPRFIGKIAAIIVEPVSGNMGVVEGSERFISTIREVCRSLGALMIADEVITGFRLAKNGSFERYGILSDITCLGKIVGGGLPAAAFGGRRDVMGCLAPIGNVYQAGTLSGNPLAMESGLQNLLLLEKEGFYEELQRKSRLLFVPIQKAIEENAINACCQWVGSMGTLFFGKKQVHHFVDALEADTDQFAHFYHYMRAKGIALPPSQHEAWFVSMAHSDESLSYTAQSIVDYLQNMC